MKKRNAFALPAKFRKNAGPHIHKKPLRPKFKPEDFIKEIEEEMDKTCEKCSYFDIIEGRCELHEIDNLTSQHGCKDCDYIEPQTEEEIF